MNFSDFLIVIAGRNNFRIQFWDIANCEVVNRKKNADLSKKSELYDDAL